MIVGHFVDSVEQKYVQPRTRQVLSLLGDDVVAQILDLCRQKARSEGEIVEHTGAARHTVVKRLVELEARGLLVRKLERTGVSGRPQNVWSQLTGRRLADFERAADSFVLDLLRAQAEDQSEGMTAQRQADVRAVES